MIFRLWDRCLLIRSTITGDGVSSAWSAFWLHHGKQNASRVFRLPSRAQNPSLPLINPNLISTVQPQPQEQLFYLGEDDWRRFNTASESFEDPTTSRCSEFHRRCRRPATISSSAWTKITRNINHATFSLLPKNYEICNWWLPASTN